MLKEHFGKYLSPYQIEGLLKRRRTKSRRVFGHGRKMQIRAIGITLYVYPGRDCGTQKAGETRSRFLQKTNGCMGTEFAAHKSSLIAHIGRVGPCQTKNSWH